MTNNSDRLALLRRRAANLHKVIAPVIVAPEPEDEPEDLPEDLPEEPEEDGGIDMDAVRSGSEEWSAGMAVYGD